MDTRNDTTFDTTPGKVPLLSSDDLANMREWSGFCASCKAWTRRNYCRQCDVFYTYKHAEDCPGARDQIRHHDHRRYDMEGELK